MISIQTRRDICGMSAQLAFFVRQGKRLGLLSLGDRDFGDYDRQNEVFENLQAELTDGGGQCLLLDLAGFMERSFAETLLGELEAAGTGCRRRIDLLLNRVPSPFIDRAIAWQRLCDHLIDDENPRRSTALVIENVDQANEQIRCDVERLIRFHITHNIRRTFLLTLSDDDTKTLPGSLLRLVELQLTI